jgi:hypothetical protein
MRKINAIAFLFVFTVLSSSVSFSDNPPVWIFVSKKAPDAVAHTRVMIGPVISFYKTNKNHASAPKQKMSGILSIKEEWRLNKKYNFFFSVGLEYMVHGMSFYSYYFKKDSLQLYNGNLDYQYSLYLHEVDVPLQVRLSFNRENQNLFSPYLVMGYHYRTLLTGFLKVKKDGEMVERKTETINFKNPLINPRCNPFVSLTLGIQQNNPSTTNTGFFAEVSYRWGFSPFLLKDDFTASSLYITGNHLTIGAGYRF